MTVILPARPPAGSRPGRGGWPCSWAVPVVPFIPIEKIRTERKGTTAPVPLAKCSSYTHPSRTGNAGITGKRVCQHTNAHAAAPRFLLYIMYAIETG